MFCLFIHDEMRGLTGLHLGMHGTYRPRIVA
jgi:hypothetical protein